MAVVALGLSASIVPVQANAAPWSPTGDMVVPHKRHTMTLLADGRILVAGAVWWSARGGEVPDNYAEIYDPLSATWSLTNHMVIPRASAAATLLAGGGVLVAGGRQRIGPKEYEFTASVEIYDPRSGTWSLTGGMSTGRAEHTVTLLSDGRVLVAGGQGLSGALASAEVYDPTVGAWSPTGNMVYAHRGHTMTLLEDGRVLVAGGWRWSTRGDVPFDGVEIYDPSTDVWSLTDHMLSARVGAAATLLGDGRVLVIGGYDALGPGGYHRSSNAEIYDPVSGSWSWTGVMGTERNDHTATLLSDGRVLVVGGQGTSGDLASAEVYDPDTNAWVPAGNMVTARHVHTASRLMDGRVLVAGGEGGGAYLNSSEIFDPAAALLAGSQAGGRPPTPVYR